MHKNVIFSCVNQFYKHSMSVSPSICLSVTLLQAGGVSWTFHSNYIKCSENIHCVEIKQDFHLRRHLQICQISSLWWISTIIWTTDHLVPWCRWIHRLGEFSEIIPKYLQLVVSNHYLEYWSCNPLHTWCKQFLVGFSDFLGTLANRPSGGWNMAAGGDFWPLSWILVINTIHTGQWGFRNYLILARLAKIQASGSQRWPKLVVYDIWPFLHFRAMFTVGLWRLSDDAAIKSLDLLVCTKSRKDWWNMVVWMHSMLYSSDVWHRCALVYLCWYTHNVNTYKQNIHSIIPEKICLSPFQHIRHITKILVNFLHNLQHTCGYNATRSNKVFLETVCMPCISQEFVVILLLGNVNRHGGYLIDPHVHIYWKTHNVH